MQDHATTKNGKSSIFQNIKNTDIRYFFICDKIISGEVVMQYLPEEVMVDNYLTKLLQGSLFQNLGHRSRTYLRKQTRVVRVNINIYFKSGHTERNENCQTIEVCWY